jgi:hypothetical protein
MLSRTGLDRQLIRQRYGEPGWTCSAMVGGRSAKIIAQWVINQYAAVFLGFPFSPVA